MNVKYLRDLTERVASTFVTAALGVAVLAGPADLLSVSLWQNAALAGGAAALALVKGILAKYVGKSDSASLDPSA